MTPPLDAESLRRGPLAATVELHRTLGSTNDRARELFELGAPLPALIVADEQTAGRGRGGNRWWSPPGALTFSVAIDAEAARLAFERFGFVSIAAAVAVIDAVRQATGLAAGLKWPNDVHLDGRKLAGVLIESPSRERLVVGVGVNVENRFGEAPPDVRARATALVEHASASRQQVLAAFLVALDQRLTQVAAGDPSPLEAARRACVLTGKTVTLRNGERTITGACLGLADEGALQLRVDGVVKTCCAGTIERVSEDA